LGKVLNGNWSIGIIKLISLIVTVISSVFVVINLETVNQFMKTGQNIGYFGLVAIVFLLCGFVVNLIEILLYWINLKEITKSINLTDVNESETTLEQN
jgi:hypothetical protein